MNPAKRKKLYRLGLVEQNQQVAVVETVVEEKKETLTAAQATKTAEVIQEISSVETAETPIALRLTDPVSDEAVLEVKKEKDKKKKWSSQDA